MLVGELEINTRKYMLLLRTCPSIFFLGYPNRTSPQVPRIERLLACILMWEDVPVTRDGCQTAWVFGTLEELENSPQRFLFEQYHPLRTLPRPQKSDHTGVKYGLEALMYLGGRCAWSLN